MLVVAAATVWPAASRADDGAADVAARARAAVVSIFATSLRDVDPSASGAGERPETDLPFRDLLKDFPPAGGADPARQFYPVVEAGSGFLVDAAGHIVTSRHIVHGADRLLVVLASGRYLAATLVGADAETDLALIRVDADVPLPYLEWGNSQLARVGDSVLLFGAPFGLAGTATRGIISARGTDPQREGLDDYLQIDAAMNRGNSGGPLVDGAGRVIGVNAAILSPTGGSVGIGFAIPSVLAQPIVEQLRLHRRVDRAWLGVEVQPMTRPIADSLQMPDVTGALVAAVAPQGPAARAGLRQGDVLLGINGAPVGHVGDLSRLLIALPPGSKLAIRLWRADGMRTVTVVAESGRDADRAAEERRPRRVWAHEDSLGLVLAPLTEDERKQYELPVGTKGVLVTSIMPGSTASYAGFLAGDVIQSIFGAEVREPADVLRQLWSAAERGRPAVLFLVIRDGVPRFVAAYLPKGYASVR